MLLFSIAMTLLPIAVVLYLLAVRKMATHSGALIGWAVAAVLAAVFFATPVQVLLCASAQGVLVSLPISMMTLLAILQVTYMEKTGCLKRIAVFLKTLAPGNQGVQTMIINVGAGTALVSMGCAPPSVLPPVLKGMGYDNRMSILLPVLGFDAFCTYAMLAAPMVTYCDLTGVTLVEAAQVFALYMPVMSVLLCCTVLYVVGGWKMLGRNWLVALLTGVVSGGIAYAIAYVSALNSAIILTGVLSGAAAILVLLAYLKLTGSSIIDSAVLTAEEKEITQKMSLAKALSPWLIMLFCLVIVAFVKPVDQFLRVTLAMPVSFIPGSNVNLRILWNAYFWIVMSTALSIPILKPDKKLLLQVGKIWRKRGIKPFVSAFVFFCLGYVMTYSGYQIGADGNWFLPDQLQNMLGVLAEGSARAFGSLYSLIAAPLGLFAGFITSSEASALAMFAKYNILTAEKLGMNALSITAATGVAAGIASIISPAKLQSAAATIDATGAENELLKQTIVIALVLTVAIAGLCLLFG